MIPEKKAHDLLSETGVSSLPVNPFALASKLNVEVKEVDLGSACDGFLLVQNYNSLIGINSKIRSKKRRTFTAAHELGHLCLDVTGDPNQKIECGPAGIDSFSRSLPEIEVRANKFASELLLPKRLVSELVLNKGLSWAAIDEISDLAEVSRTATARKFVQLTDEACALIVSENGCIKWFTPSPAFGLQIDMDARLLSPGCPADLATKGQSPANEFVDVSAASWVRSSPTIKNEMLQEWSLPVNQYGQVLTLLWDDLGLGDADENSDESQEEDEEKFDPRFGWETPSFGRKR